MALRRILLLSFILMLPFVVSAQRDTMMFLHKAKIQKSLLKTNPTTILAGPMTIFNDSGGVFPFTSEYKLLYEVPIAPKQSLQIGVSYLTKNIFLLAAGTDTGRTARDIRNISIAGFRIQGMFRYYLGKENLSPKGFYVGPHASYAYTKLGIKSAPGYYLHFVNWNINAILGYQLVIRQKVGLDFFTGLGYRNNTLEENAPNTSKVVNRNEFLTGRLKISFGFSFGVAL